MTPLSVRISFQSTILQAYPHQIPPLLLREPEYLTANHVQQLHRIVQDKARSKIGEVMIFEVIHFCYKDFLSDNTDFLNSLLIQSETSFQKTTRHCLALGT